MSIETHIFLSNGVDLVSNHFLNLFEYFNDLYIDRTIVQSDNFDSASEKNINIDHDDSLPDDFYRDIVDFIFTSDPLIKILLFCGKNLTTSCSIYCIPFDSTYKYYMTDFFNEPSIEFSFYQIHQLKNHDLLSINNHWLQ